MEMRQLRYFVEIAKWGSFSRAAKSLSVAQPALSRQIRLLEESLGAPLLYRNGRGAVLTSAGEIFKVHANDILESASRADRQIADLRGEPVGEVVLGLPPSVSAVLLRNLFLGLAEQYPRVKLRVQEGFSGSVAEWLMEGKVDLAIIYEHFQPRHTHSERLLIENLAIVHSPNFPVPDVITARNISTVPLIIPCKPHGLRSVVERRVADMGGRLNVAIEIDSFQIMRDLAIEGMAATILPEGAVSREIEQGILVIKPLRAPEIRRVLSLVYPGNVPLEKAQRAFIALARKVAADIQSRRPETVPNEGEDYG